MLTKIFKRKDSFNEIRLIATLLGIGNIAVLIKSGLIDISLIAVFGEALVVTSALFFATKLFREYRAFVKKKQMA